MAIALVISTTREKSYMNWARTCIWITIYFIKNYKRQIYKTKFPKYSHSHIFAFIVGIDLVTPETYRRHKGVAMHTTHKPCIDFLQCLECTDWSSWILRHFHPAMHGTCLNPQTVYMVIKDVEITPMTRWAKIEPTWLWCATNVNWRAVVDSNITHVTAIYTTINQR